MSNTTQIAIGVNKNLLNAALDESYDCPNLQAFYHQAKVRTSVTTSNDDIVMFGSYTTEPGLAETIDSELELAVERYISLNTLLPGCQEFGIRVDLSPQNNIDTHAQNCYYLGPDEDFDFSLVVFVVPTPKTSSKVFDNPLALNSPLR